MKVTPRRRTKKDNLSILFLISIGKILGKGVQMIQLLQHYSLSDIIIFIVLFALVIKNTISFWDWGVERLNKIFNQERKKIDETQKLEERLRHGSQIMEDLKDNQTLMENTLSDLTEKIDILIGSDKDSIKAYITKDYHRFKDLGWIDDFSLDCLERRYGHYKVEGGNSFISHLMEEIRQLPKKSLQEQEREEEIKGDKEDVNHE